MNKTKLMFRNCAIVFLLFGIMFPSFGQIDMSDSSAVVMAHWKLKESQKFNVSSFKNSTEEDKLISSEAVSYNVTINVLDSTQVGYLLEWTRSNFDITIEDELDRQLLEITNDIPFMVLTDEFGSSIESLNWEDIGNEIKKRAEKLKEAYSDSPGQIQRIDKAVRQASNKDLVEMNLMLDIHQYLAFHGAKYKFDERIDMKVKVPNNYGGDPLDANSTLKLDQINKEQGTVIIRSSQRVNPYQLTAVTYDYLKSLNIVGADLPPKEEFPMVAKLEWGGSEIHVNSGWVIYSVQTKQTTNDKVVIVEECTIEILREEVK